VAGGFARKRDEGGASRYLNSVSRTVRRGLRAGS
jgi:hypothetical protein